MSDNKKYYYLKIKETFFDSEEMKIIETQKNGVEYQNLYLKMCLLSLKSSGCLLFKDILPYDITMLSTVLRVNIDTVKTGIEIFLKLGLIEQMDSGKIYMSDIHSLIGHGSTEAERIAKYRKKIKGTDGVTLYGKCTPELELELELELERELELELERERELEPPAEVKNKKPRVNLIPPTLEEATQYCNESKIIIDVAYTYNHYSMADWKYGKGRIPLKDWHRAFQNARDWTHNIKYRENFIIKLREREKYGETNDGLQRQNI